MLKSHLTILETCASRYPSSPAFHLPKLDTSGTQVQAWDTITYQHFYHDVLLFASHWSRVLEDQCIPQGSVIGLWIGGLTYTDILHIYGVSRAGYVPQMFSIRLPNPVVIYELMRKANARALIFESCYEDSIVDCPVPSYLATSRDSLDVTGEALPTILPVTGDNCAFIFHTSGSTSGSPKLVPCSYSWLDSAVRKSNQIGQPFDSQRQDVTVWMGSMCHIGQSFMLIGSLQHGSCVVQPSRINFSSEELIDMIERCNLNRLNQFSTFLALHLRNSRNDCELLSKLQGLDQVLYSGLPLSRDEEEWAMKKGIKLKNLFGSTECGAMLVSMGGKGRAAPLLQPLNGMSYSFRPIDPIAAEGHLSTGRLLELVILAESPDCPDKTLRHEDGHFHTGDLFVEAASGAYVFRGRGDDWIKSENGLRCDTKAIEDNVKSLCGNLVKECVVVGAGRPSPAMFLEPVENDVDQEKLKSEIIRRTRPFHSRRYFHERITSSHMIVIVHQNTLPRTVTKGNIRRKEVEERFKGQLDCIYEIYQ
ncbi:hypothetical protein AX17_000488 [Amanita inopinata Kibby_2008]|nr:hypothetical protein AX17_000488 [Amanita inopinata Kibby_2008]